jgi:hypothetical protein
MLIHVSLRGEYNIYRLEIETGKNSLANVEQNLDEFVVQMPKRKFLRLGV